MKSSLTCESLKKNITSVKRDNEAMASAIQSMKIKQEELKEAVNIVKHKIHRAK